MVAIENKILYRKWAETIPNLPLFFQPFWLDLIDTDENWEVVLSRQKNGEIVGVFPYFRQRRKGIWVIQNPLLTPFLGCWINEASYKKSRGLSKFLMETLKDLIEQLPQPFYFTANCHPQLSNVLPLHWKGYQYTTFYTYILKDLQNLDKVKMGINRNMRRNIQKAEMQLILEKKVDAKTFYNVHKMTFDRQNMAVPFSKAFFAHLDRGILQQEAGQKFSAKDEDGNVQAVAYLLWDKERAYYFLAGENPDFRGSGASIFLIWEAIKFTQVELGLSIFDFAGSMMQNVEVIRRQFGATQVPYFHIYKSKNKWIGMLVELLKKSM
jgi:hypothetical protein